MKVLVGICRTSQLSEIAIMILSSPGTSEVIERSFSTQANIHRKHRNRLLNTRIEKLTFIKQNLKLLD